ncbi:hypothetical protein LTR66_007836 [Elasticomyces elasticus]|nr:hypothetical protein LTR66_007836 [Elasticomyces elasticus]
MALPVPGGKLSSSDPEAGVSAVDEVTVLVTGFGPFRDEFPVNPSFLIADSLPPLLNAIAGSPVSVRILIHPHPVRVAYKDVRELVPRLLGSKDAKFDIVLHIGMASGRDYYSIELQGHRDGYDKNADVDEKTPAADDGATFWPDCDPVLQTSFAFDGLWRKWQSNLLGMAAFDKVMVDVDARPSEDPGHYLCDFIYYSSLAWYFRKGPDGRDGERPVMFLHVPADSSPVDIERGRGVAVGLIRALADNWSVRKRGSGSAGPLKG